MRQNAQFTLAAALIGLAAAAIMRWIAFRICHLSSEVLTVDLDSER